MENHKEFEKLHKDLVFARQAYHKFLDEFTTIIWGNVLLRKAKRMLTDENLKKLKMLDEKSQQAQARLRDFYKNAR